MTHPSVGDVIAAIRQLAEDIDFTTDVTEPKELRIARFVAAIKTSALVERVSRQPQKEQAALRAIQADPYGLPVLRFRQAPQPTKGARRGLRIRPDGGRHWRSSRLRN